MKLRKFEAADSAIIASWVLDEEGLYKWSANILEQWPLKPETIFSSYKDGIENKTIFPVVAEDDNGKIFAHCFLRFPYDDKSIARVGFVIVDSSCRGKGYGKKFLALVEDYAKKEFGCTKLSLGVFLNNPSALNCYLSSNFIPDGRISDFECKYGKWRCLEMMKDITENSISYRKATNEEVPAIQKFVDEAKILMNKQSIPQWDEIYPTCEDFYDDAAKNELYVGEINGRLAVCFTLNQFQDEDYLKVEWKNSGNDFMVIHRLCVNPEFQGKGIGEKTCRYIEGLVRSKNCSSIKLDAFTQNPISLAMYQKLGYKTQGYADWRKGKFKLMELILK